MGFRFRKSFKVFPGVKVNLSTKGVSTSVGVKGASVNLSSRGVRTTVGIPGTGVSWSGTSGGGRARGGGGGGGGGGGEEGQAQMNLEEVSGWQRAGCAGTGCFFSLGPVLALIGGFSLFGHMVSKDPESSSWGGSAFVLAWGLAMIGGGFLLRWRNIERFEEAGRQAEETSREIERIEAEHQAEMQRIEQEHWRELWESEGEHSASFVHICRRYAPHFLTRTVSVCRR